MTTVKLRYLMHSRYRGCAFCSELERIAAAGLVGDEEERVVDELFDRADRAAKARQLYGRRKGHR